VAEPVCGFWAEILGLKPRRVYALISARLLQKSSKIVC